VLWTAMILAMPGLHSQPVTMFRGGPGYLAAGLGSDAFLNLSLSYHHFVPGKRENRGSLFHAGMQVPVLIALRGEGNHPFRIDAGYRWGGTCRDRFYMDGQLDLFLMNHSTVLGTFRPVGAEMTGSAGFQLRRSFLGVFCEWHHVLATHITHSEYSGQSFKGILPDGSPVAAPVDGWYAHTASLIGYGIRYSTPLGGRLVLKTDIGAVSHLSEYTGMLDAMMIGQLPFMMDVQLYYCLRCR